jgi:hypothetical protein
VRALVEAGWYLPVRMRAHTSLTRLTALAVRGRQSVSNLPICQIANLQVCKSVNLTICRSVHLQIWKSANRQI